MKNIETKRLLLAELTIADAEAVYGIYNTPEVIQHYTVMPIKDKAGINEFIRRITGNGNFIWSIRLLQDTDNIIGDCALHHWNEAMKTVEIGGSLLPQFWGQGIIAEAFDAIIQYAAEAFDIKTITATTNTENKKAIRAVKKLGFNVCGTAGEETVLVKKLS